MILKRQWWDPHSTGGLLWIPMPVGETRLYTIEPVQCIPAGTYRVDLTVSGRAKAGTLWSPDPEFRLPELFEVPGHTAIRIHAGNTSKNTIGCILVGYSRYPGETIGQSRDALTELMQLVTFPTTITIEGMR